MQEALITISGTLLNYPKSETIRVAIDTLANVLAEAFAAKDEGMTLALTERYLGAADQHQELLVVRPARVQ